MRRLLSQSVFAFGFVAAALFACSSDETTSPPPGNTSSSGSVATGDALENAQPVVDNYAKNVFQNYSDALEGAKKMKTAIDAFTASPTAETQQAAKDAWIAARVPYQQSEGYRFYNGPIDNDDEANPGPEGDINSWPLDENFIDYTKDDAKAGLINDADFVITKDTIQEQNTAGGEANVSDGFHAIEFLLWGQDTDPQSDKTSGHRSFTDYTTKDNADRRKAYLTAVTELLIDDLQKVTDAWKPDADNYRKTFVADAPGAIKNMLIGIGSLANAELSGERMVVAYKDKGQEDEHSCFSDTTNADLQGNFFSIRNVYLGSYGSSTGDGITKLVAAVDPALDTKFKADLDTAAAAFTKMQEVPFDYAIQLDDAAPERKAILDAIQAVKTLATDTTDVGTKLGVTLELETSEASL